MVVTFRFDSIYVIRRCCLLISVPTLRLPVVTTIANEQIFTLYTTSQNLIQHFARMLPIFSGHFGIVEGPYVVHRLPYLPQMFGITSLDFVNIHVFRKIVGMEFHQVTHLEGAFGNVLGYRFTDIFVNFEYVNDIILSH